jgi:hypothetical protein
LSLPLFISRNQHFNIFLKKTLSLPWSLNMRHKSQHAHKKAVTYYLNTCYRRTVYLGKEWILFRLDKVVFGWAVSVAFVQLSPGLLWTTSILFCMYLLSVTVCAAIYRLDCKDQLIYKLHVIWAYSLTCAFRHL